MIKRAFLIICLISFVFSFNVSAENAKIVEAIKPQGEFYVYGEQDQKIAEILGMNESELDDYCSQNMVAYLAVNKENTKQIKVTSKVTDFSNSIINISGLSDDNIATIVPDITGIAGAKGEVISKDGQKFIKVQFKTNDSGGEYILTQYITVAGRTNIILSFYTAASENEDYIYIEKTFESFSSPLFISNDQDDYKAIGYVILAAAIIFGIACMVIVITIVKDIKMGNRKSLNTEEIKENDN